MIVWVIKHTSVERQKTLKVCLWEAQNRNQTRGIRRNHSETWVKAPGASLCSVRPWFNCLRPFSIFKWNDKYNRLTQCEKNRVKRQWGCERDERGERVKSDLAEARRTGRELSDLYRFIVIGVILVVRIDVMVTIRTGWQGGEMKYKSCQLNIKCAFLNGAVPENYCTSHKPNIDVTAVLYRHINPNVLSK